MGGSPVHRVSRVEVINGPLAFVREMKSNNKTYILRERIEYIEIKRFGSRCVREENVVPLLNK